MKRILLVFICFVMSGCAIHDFVPSAYYIELYSGTAFTVKDKVYVRNDTPSRKVKVAWLLYSDLKDWGRQLSYGLKQNLESRGAEIDSNAEKTISVRVTRALTKKRFFFHTAYMECVINLGNGYAEKITAYHRAQVDANACAGLLAVVVERIMSNPAVISYFSSA